jgi:hypothetical protein
MYCVASHFQISNAKRQLSFGCCAMQSGRSLLMLAAIISPIALMMEGSKHLKRRLTSTRLQGAITQKTVIFILATMRTSHTDSNAYFGSSIPAGNRN